MSLFLAIAGVILPVGLTVGIYANLSPRIRIRFCTLVMLAAAGLLLVSRAQASGLAIILLIPFAILLLRRTSVSTPALTHRDHRPGGPMTQYLICGSLLCAGLLAGLILISKPMIVRAPFADRPAIGLLDLLRLFLSDYSLTLSAVSLVFLVSILIGARMEGADTGAPR